MRVFNILNLGAGVQSTAVYLLAMEGRIQTFDAAIFADTQEEPAQVYTHLQWLHSIGRPPILVRTRSKLGDDLLKGENATGGRFVSIPAFTTARPEDERETPLTGCEVAIVKRQCTKEYKSEVVERTIRREILGLKPRQRVPKDVLIRQHFGISDEEGFRMRRIRERFQDVPWAEPVFPLILLGWTREHCLEYLKPRVPHAVPRSACVFCPYKRAAEWLWLKQNDTAGWSRAVEVDAGLRTPGLLANRKFDQKLYVHRSCLPLPMIDLEAEAKKESKVQQPSLFNLFDCGEGMCGV